jgi:hypothetical protein
VKSPETVKENGSSMVSVLPVVTVKFPWAKVLAITDTVVKSVKNCFILLVLFFEDYF